MPVGPTKDRHTSTFITGYHLASEIQKCKNTVSKTPTAHHLQLIMTTSRTLPTTFAASQVQRRAIFPHVTVINRRPSVTSMFEGRRVGDERGSSGPQWLRRGGQDPCHLTCRRYVRTLCLYLERPVFALFIVY